MITTVDTKAHSNLDLPPEFWAEAATEDLF
jgi:hypothetical protein